MSHTHERDCECCTRARRQEQVDAMLFRPSWGSLIVFALVVGAAIWRSLA